MPPKRSRALETYKQKRDFRRTPEPKPKTKASATGRLFVVQKHRAQRLHYDFRIELDGALLSWAVPKGPSLDPSEKRLAVQTEDHPVEYGAFEGVIPEDEYGGGTVMLWDRGQWSTLEDPQAALNKGTLKFKLEGQKLRGAWTLVRLKDKGAATGNWLLIKERDDEVRNEDAFRIIDEEPFSAVTGRTISEIASAKDRVWTRGGSQGVTEEAAHCWRRGLYRHIDFAPSKLARAKKSGMPHELSTLSPKEFESVPPGDEWIHEILQLGKRVLCWVEQSCVTLRSSVGEDWSQELPQIIRAASSLPVHNTLLDGVVSDVHTDGAKLPVIIAADPKYNVFDILFCDGYDLRATPLLDRKQLLRRVLVGTGPSLVYCDYLEGRGDVLLAEAQRLAAPGIVSKKATSKYSLREGANWRVVRLTKHDNAPPASKPGRARAAVDEPEVVVAGIKLTHPARILYPEERITKQMLAEYFEGVAPKMLPYLQRRPLSLYRCPGGIERECFFQKQMGEMASKYLRSAQAGEEPYIVLDGAAGLVTLAQWNVLEIHGWGCGEDDLDRPDLMVFDLDPGPDVPWEQIVEGAKGLRLLLDELGLASFVKTSGGNGLHVVVPLTRRHAWHEVKDFAARVSRKIVDVAPKHFTAMMSKPERRGKVFIDYHRNDRGSTCVAPYSTRARPGALVSAPISWEELERPQPRFHIFEMRSRLEGHIDPWQTFFETKQGISPAAVTWLRR